MENAIKYKSILLRTRSYQLTTGFMTISQINIGITQNKGKESENSYQKLKRSWWTGI